MERVRLVVTERGDSASIFLPSSVQQMAALPPSLPSPIMIRHGAILAGGGRGQKLTDANAGPPGDLGKRLNDAPIDFAGRVS